jgi:hypothetical protein
VLDALRAFNIRPGDYVAPHPHGSSPDFAELSRRGPVVMMTVLPGDVVIAKNLVLWFLYCIVVASCAAYGAVIAGVFAWLWPR